MDSLAFLQSIPPEAIYAIVFLVVGIESLGVPVPGEITLISAALLASQGISNPIGVGVAGALGAAAGDSTGYYIGHRYGRRLFTRLEKRFPRHFTKARLTYAERVFHRHGPWTVFFGRFVAILRIFAGPLAGVLKMHYTRFLLANVLGAITWSAVVTGVIYYLGVAAEYWLHELSWVALGVAIVGGLVMSWVLKKRFMHID